MTKICIKCKIEKSKFEFCKNKNTKDGLSKRCKTCAKIYYNKNKNKFLEYSKEHYVENKDQIKEYYSDNKDQFSKKHKEYYLENKDQIKEQKKDYQKQRRKKDPIFKLRQNISNIINQALKKQDSSKFGKSIIQYLPYTIDEFRKYIELQFEDWMNWDNYGRTNNYKRTWQIDHIIPQSLLPFASMEEDNFRKCWALENLRPMESFANIKKSNKIEPK
jgi:hypothetical protein